jgi:hypothetical protein
MLSTFVMTFLSHLWGPYCDECYAISVNEWHDIFMMNAEAVFLVVFDPSMIELWATKTVLCLDLYGSRSLTAHS